MDWEALVPILFFAIPLVISLLDKRAKKQKGVPPVQARPVFPPDAEDEIPEQVRNDNSSPVDFQPVGEVAPENVRLRRTPPNASGVGPLPRTELRVATVFRGDLPDRNQPEGQPSEEGQRANHRKAKKQTESEDGAQQKLEIDKKKLILYSEILKPKFDA